MRPRLAASLLTIAAIVAVALVLATPGGLRWQAHPGTACEDLMALRESLDLTSLGDQAVIRARAVQLAAALTAAAGEGGPATVPGGAALQASVLASLKAVIADPAATSQDLAAALMPLAQRCGVDLQG